MAYRALFSGYLVALFLTSSPSVAAAKKVKPQKTHEARRRSEKSVGDLDEEIQNLRTEMYTTRATWNALEKTNNELKQQIDTVRTTANNSASQTKIYSAIWSAIGFVVGAIVVAFINKRREGSGSSTTLGLR